MQLRGWSGLQQHYYWWGEEEHGLSIHPVWFWQGWQVEGCSFSLRLSTVMWLSLESETSAVKMVTFTPLLPLIVFTSDFILHVGIWRRVSLLRACLLLFLFLFDLCNTGPGILTTTDKFKFLDCTVSVSSVLFMGTICKKWVVFSIVEK